jgi:hypothetical protein
MTRESSRVPVFIVRSIVIDSLVILISTVIWSENSAVSYQTSVLRYRIISNVPRTSSPDLLTHGEWRFGVDTWRVEIRGGALEKILLVAMLEFPN